MAGILCFYHAPCNDGSASAAALRHRMNLVRPDDPIEFHPMTFTVEWDDPLPEEYLHRFDHDMPVISDIYIVDISLSPTKHRQIVDHLREIGKIGDADPHTVCIDHHRTALDNLDILTGYCDDTLVEIGPGLSGATLVWKYFNRLLGEDRPVPTLLSYVADQDIWEWKLEGSKEINSALNTLDGHAEEMIRELEWSMENEEEWRKSRFQQGSAILSVIDSQVQKAFSKVREFEGNEGVEFRVVNSTENSSELGNTLCQESHHKPNSIAMIYSIQRDWSVKCSLRSISGGRLNARQIAERFGGGGHDNAAGCRFPNLEAFREALVLLGDSLEQS